MGTDEPAEADDYEVRAAPPGFASQGGAGEMVVLPGPRPRIAGRPDDDADAVVDEES
jgi:hypothetical protein